MTANDDIKLIARKAAEKNFGAKVIDAVIVEPTLDSEGRDALRITLVLRPGKLDQLTGDKTLDTLYKIQTELSKLGEQRLAIVEYATRKELEKSGAPKS